jgi:putative membrane protein
MWNRLITALLALSIALAALPAHAQAAAERPDYWHYGGNWGWGHMIFGSVMMLLFWGVIIVGIVLVVRWLAGGISQESRSSPIQKRSLEILEERFAKGEIDKDEFEERKRLLSD